MKTKKISTLLVFGVAALSLAACGGKNNPTSTSEPVKTAEKTTTSEVKEYEVTFDGTSMEKKLVKEGDNLSKPAEPTKTDHIFAGWYLDSNYQTEATFPIKVTKNTTLYALFYDYKTAFSKARENTIGANVAGYEYDYTINASAAYSAISADGTTEGNAKYSTSGDVSFYDSHTNTGKLFYDGSGYQIKRGNELQKINVDANDVMKYYKAEEVDATYKFDSSSFAKALFVYTDDKIDSISKTTTANEYKLNTNMNFSQALEMASGYLGNPLVTSLISNLPDTNVETGMYVTFNEGKLNKYRYEMHINVSAVKFDLVYNLTFKNIGVAQTITPRSFAGLSLTASEISLTNTELNTLLTSYKTKAHSGYDFKFTMGVDFPSQNEINAAFKGSTKRKVDGDTVYFHNDIEIDSDFKNNDLYKDAGIADIHVKKTKLSNGDVYNIEKKALLDKTYKIDNYQDNATDSYFLLNVLNGITSPTFIQKVTKNSEVTYSFGLSSANVEELLTWLNNELTLDPLLTATAETKIFGDFKANSVSMKDSELKFIFLNNTLKAIEVSAKGTVDTKYTGSKSFTTEANAQFDFKLTIDVTTDGDAFEPYDTVNKAK